MSRFLPHRGLPLLADDGRVRWTARLLAVVAVLTTWGCGPTLLDRFAPARAAALAMYPTRRRPGVGVEGFLKALVAVGPAVPGHAVPPLARGRPARRRVAALADRRPARLRRRRLEVQLPTYGPANEGSFGVSGKANGGPQQLLTCRFHAATGMLWGWTRDGVRGASERAQLRRLLPLLPPAALLVADAGFCGYELLKALLDRGNHFLVRVGSNVTLIRKLGFVRREGKQTVYLWPLDQQGRQKGFMPRTLKNVRPPLVLRLIELADAQGKRVFLLTSVPEASRLTDRAAARLYRLRWGVEVMWRGLKQTLGHHKALARTPGRAGARNSTGPWPVCGCYSCWAAGGWRRRGEHRRATARRRRCAWCGRA